MVVFSHVHKATKNVNSVSKGIIFFSLRPIYIYLSKRARPVRIVWICSKPSKAFRLLKFSPQSATGQRNFFLP